ncbi:MAG TPA: hypothetical protein VJH23_01100 [archaeon]|nr:hypothetical protein [archaeon]
MPKHNRPRLGRVTKDIGLLKEAKTLANREMARRANRFGEHLEGRDSLPHATFLALEGYSEAEAQKRLYKHLRQSASPDVARAIIPNALRNQFRPVRKALRDLRKNAATKSSKAQSQSAKRRARSR